MVIASVEKCAAINKEKADSVHQRMLSVKLLFLGLGRNRGQVAKIVIFATIRDGFEVFRIAPVGDADTGDLSLFPLNKNRGSVIDVTVLRIRNTM